MGNPSPVAFLEVASAQAPRTIALEQGTTWRIGRGDQCEVHLPDDLISRQHAVVQRMGDGQFYLIDMGSRNGSFVNDVRVSVPQVLKNGDALSIGPIILLFRCPDASPSTTQVEGQPESGTKAYFRPRLITVLVMDIRGFTTLSQQIEQSLLCNLIATWFGHGGRIMRERGSWSQKYIGDAVMAVWLHKSAEDALPEALLAIQACVEFAQIAGSMQAQFSLPSAMRVGAGINTGFASIGNAGSGAAIDFTAMGETVNAAFRIESCTKEIGVDLALGKSTFDLLQESAGLKECFQPHEVALKGYEKAAAVWGAPFPTVHSYMARAQADAATRLL